MKRREFLSLVGRAVPGGIVASAAATYAVAVEPTWIELRQVFVPVADIDVRLRGLTICQLSDIHRSDIVAGSYVREAALLAQSFEPDLVALTGDFISGDADCFDLVADDLAPLAQTAPVLATMGNHDYDHWYRAATPRLPDGHDRLGTSLARAGIRLLRDERAVVPIKGRGAAVEVFGLDDYWSERFDGPAALRSAPDTGLTRLVLSHNPDSFAAVKAERFDLMLCGHTHGGQVRLPFLGAPYCPVADRRFLQGLVSAEGRFVYTNRGLGYNRRIRFGVRPEVTILTLV